MKTFKNLAEQHREQGRFKPVKPHVVKSNAGASPRTKSDSADVKLQEDFGVCQTCESDPCVCSDSFGFVTETQRMSASVKLQRALERERQKSEASRKRAEELLKPKEPVKQPVKESFAETLVHKEKANAAKESGDTHAFHGHMVDHHVSMANFHREHGDEKTAKEHDNKAKEHHSNMERYYREEVENIDEKISVVSGHAPRQQGRFAPNNQIRTDKTSIGRVVSGTLYTGTRKPKQPMKKEEVEQISEGRPSQRHPLEGHEYHKKSDEALVHIAKDAHAAAEAMKGHNTTAENKYRDQANDSATVRHYRKTHGMADWYKKKYGHVKIGRAHV